jgi:hypothetical protein
MLTIETWMVFHQHPLELIQVFFGGIGSVKAAIVWWLYRGDYNNRRIGEGGLEILAISRVHVAVCILAIQIIMAIGGMFAIALEPPAPINQQAIFALRGMCVSGILLWLSYKLLSDRIRFLKANGRRDKRREDSKTLPGASPTAPGRDL